jgi:hypothetical protein
MSIATSKPKPDQPRIGSTSYFYDADLSQKITRFLCVSLIYLLCLFAASAIKFLQFQANNLWFDHQESLLHEVPKTSPNAEE